MPIAGELSRRGGGQCSGRGSERVVTVPSGAFPANLLVTNEWSPLEPTVTEEKDYVLDLGLVRATTTKGGGGESVRVAILHQ